MKFDSSADFQFTIGGVTVGTWNSAGLSLPAGTPLNILNSSAPASPANGDLWITSTGLYAQVAGATVGPMGAGGGGGMTNPMTTAGDMIYGGASGTPTRLALTVSGVMYGGATAPAWTASADLGWNNTSKVLSIGGSLGMGATPAANYKIDTLNSAANDSFVRFKNSSTTFSEALEVAGSTAIARVKAVGSAVGGTTATTANNTAIYEGTGAGGTNIVASNASGSVRIFTGGVVDDVYPNAFNRRVTITSTGDVAIGMGTASPAYMLDIQDEAASGDVGIRFRNTQASSTGRSVFLLTAGATGGGTQSTALYAYPATYTRSGAQVPEGGMLYNGGTAGLAIGTGTGGMISFYTNGIADANHRMIIGTGGNVGIAGYTYNSVPTYTLSFGGDAVRTIGMERRTTAAGGNQLSIRGGGAQSASVSSDLNGGSIVLIPGVSTGTGVGLVRVQANSTALASGTTDNTAVDREVTGMCKVNFHASSAAVLTCLPASGTGAAYIIEYCLELRGSATNQYYILYSDTIVSVYNNAGTLANSQGGTGATVITRDATLPAFNVIFSLNTSTGALTVSVSNTANPWASGIVTSRFTYTVRYFGHTAISAF